MYCRSIINDYKLYNPSDGEVSGSSHQCQHCNHRGRVYSRHIFQLSNMMIHGEFMSYLLQDTRTETDDNVYMCYNISDSRNEL